MPARILVADIGGTNVRFALAVQNGDEVKIVDLQTFKVGAFSTFLEAARAYLIRIGEKPECAAFAAAGPVSGDCVKLTNSSWVVDVAEIRSGLCLDTVLVMNDFEALAWSVSVLGPDDLLRVKQGTTKQDAPILVLGPGTGFGQALVVPTDTGQKVVPTEGGHVAYAPYTELEISIVNSLVRQHGRVTVEHLLSGGGLADIYRVLTSMEVSALPVLSAKEITDAAIAGHDALSLSAVNFFCSLLGRVAGEGVLSTGALGGVFIGGGIVPRLKKFLEASDFENNFLQKGTMSHYVKGVPIDLITNPYAALLGAARFMRSL